jgi:hypothetical protein
MGAANPPPSNGRLARNGGGSFTELLRKARQGDSAGLAKLASVTCYHGRRGTMRCSRAIPLRPVATISSNGIPLGSNMRASIHSSV